MVNDEAKSLPQVATELKDLTVAYAKQETVDPLKGLGRFIGFGAIGMFSLGIGVVLMMLAGLRALQTETADRFTGSLSWVPYVISFVVLVALALLALRAITRDPKGSK